MMGDEVKEEYRSRHVVRHGLDEARQLSQQSGIAAGARAIMHADTNSLRWNGGLGP